ncbi:prephenate dehydratase [Candidatus Nanosalina sp. VS9-1]|uniref:prephenate dehydratase n=1 Tax=Candidatus Nanosalina sp. VS9-1 TaxID=3388566 RepID=UPI0039E14471
MKVALLGPEGTYTHQAAEKYFEDLEPEFCSTIREVFESDTEAKLVPIENSLGGGVTDTIDLLREKDEKISGEVVLPIQHALISDEKSIEDIEKVKSHPQALAQCKQIIEQHGWSTEETNSTADAVTGLETGEAALASEIAAEINDKNILKRSVQDRDVNVTRFLVLNGEPEAREKSSLILEPGEDRPGLLHAMLSCFAGHEINLSHIQSRPTKEKLGEYYFYVEAEASGEKLQKAVTALETYGDVQNLGGYRKAERPE